MTEDINSQSNEDQLIAAISHAGVLVPIFGTVIPVIVYLTQKDRSDFLKKQSLQAAVWQLIALLGYFLSMGCYFFGFMMIFPFSIIAESDIFSMDPSSEGLLFGGFFILFMLLMLAYMVGWLAYLGFGIAGSVRMLRRKDFQYPVIGKWIDRRLEANSESETSETSESSIEGISEPSKGVENDS